MREILFRGKRLDNGEWVEGNLVFSLDADEEWRTIIIPIRNSYMFSSGNEDEDLGFENWHRVDPKTVGQFTGLTDKNGMKIFEGDILRRENTRGIIRFKNGSFIFRWKKVDKYRPDFFKDCILNQYSWFSEVEVIGNIFDNPELIEGSQDSEVAE